MTQKFSYHMHSNSLGIFDGQSTTKDMINKAAEVGFEEMGISNHLTYHPTLIKTHPMFFNEYDKLEDTIMRCAEEIREEAAKAPIKVSLGFEVDFFPSNQWRDAFEKIREKVQADYYIGTGHFIRDDLEENICCLYYPPNIGPKRTKEYLDNGTKNYYKNLVLAVESGYFDFIAHLDVLNLFRQYDEFDRTKEIMELVETLAKHNHAYEINTSGWSKINIQHPQDWIIEELCKRDVPVVINDDAHHVDQVARFFPQAEELLAKLNYKNRWTFNK